MNPKNPSNFILTAILIKFVIVMGQILNKLAFSIPSSKFIDISISLNFFMRPPKHEKALNGLYRFQSSKLPILAAKVPKKLFYFSKLLANTYIDC